MEEILVKGSDGKWYIARDGKLIPHDVAAPEKPVSKPAAVAVAAPPAKSPMPIVAPKAAPAPAPIISKQKPAPPVVSAPIKPAVPKVSLLPPTAAKKPAVSAPQMQPSDDLEKSINDAVVAAKLNFPDPSLTKRFKLLVASRLREVRRADDVQTLLARETKVGGLGLTEADAARVGQIIETAFTEFHKKWEQVEAERQKAVIKAREAVAKKTQAVMSGEIENEKVNIKNEEKKEEPKAKPVKPSLPAGVIKKEEPKIEPFTKAVVKPVAALPSVSVKPAAPPSVPAKPKISVTPAPNTPSVTDIRKPRLFGPADELREMKLVDFRRMGQASEATARIKSKIDMIGSESLVRQREAILAWKQSEPYTLYSEMMGAAMAKGKSIDSEISERAKSGKGALTIDEIDAIMGLSESLRN